jgi:hypothetical protein
MKKSSTERCNNKKRSVWHNNKRIMKTKQLVWTMVQLDWHNWHTLGKQRPKKLNSLAVHGVAKLRPSYQNNSSISVPARDCVMMMEDNYCAKKLYLNDSRRILKLNWDVTHNITLNHKQYLNDNIVMTELSRKPKTENTATVQHSRTDFFNTKL